MQNSTLYNLTKDDCKIIANQFNNDVDKIALILWNKGLARTLNSGINKAKKIINYAN